MTATFRLKQFSPRSPCYYCGAPPPSSREHAPPDMMFNGFRCDKITVPSCSKHNTDKNLRDRGIITGLVMSAYQLWQHKPDSPSLTKNVIKAIKIHEKNFNQAQNEVALRDFISTPPQHLMNLRLPYLQPKVEIKGWVKQLTAALVWSVTGTYDPQIDWDKTLVDSPNYFQGPAPMEIETAQSTASCNYYIEERLQHSTWYPGWSSGRTGYPSDLYCFELCFFEGEQKILFRHRFYNSASIWYAGFTAPTETAQQLVKALGA